MAWLLEPVAAVPTFTSFGTAVPEALTVLPGKALAATAASTPVSVTLPATSQRLARTILRKPASRIWDEPFDVMYRCLR